MTSCVTNDDRSCLQHKAYSKSCDLRNHNFKMNIKDILRSKGKGRKGGGLTSKGQNWWFNISHTANQTQCNLIVGYSSKKNTFSGCHWSFLCLFFLSQKLMLVAILVSVNTGFDFAQISKNLNPCCINWNWQHNNNTIFNYLLVCKIYRNKKQILTFRNTLKNCGKYLLIYFPLLDSI